MDIYMKLSVIFCLVAASVADWDDGPKPTIDVPFVNVTVMEGDTAILPCYIKDLGKFKVAWLYQELHLITVSKQRITDDPRFVLEQPVETEWNLHIKNVTDSDEGQYLCRINTYPFISKIVNLAIIVPAKIRTDVSSNDTTITEGNTLVLICNATGIPKPLVVWSKYSSSFKSSGEVLTVENVTRSYSGTYVCFANNGGTAFKQFKVSVEFAPEVTSSAKRIHQVIEREVFLWCKIVANPLADMYWLKGNATLEHLDKEKYQVSSFSGYPDGMTSTLSLILPNLQKDQLGQYTCVANNSICYNFDTVTVHEFSGIITSTVETTNGGTNHSDAVNTSNPFNESKVAPEVTVLAKRVGQFRGRETVLDCKIMANPHDDMYWLKDNATLAFFDREMFQEERYEHLPDRTFTTLSLRLPNLQEVQLGVYTCFANNSLGKDFDTVVLYEYAGQVHEHDTCLSSKVRQGDVSSGNMFELDALFVMMFYWITFSSITNFT